MPSPVTHPHAASAARQLAVPLPDGTQLSTHIEGPADGPGTVVLVHGLSVTSALWRRHVPLLTEQNLRVVRYDQRGHGHSTRGAAPLTLDQLADDLAHLIGHAAPRRSLVLAGHSMGAMTLMRLTARHPRLAPRISGLVLVSPPPGGLSTRTGNGAGQALLAGSRDLLATACTRAPRLLDTVRRQLPATSRWTLRPPTTRGASPQPLPCRQGLHALPTADIAALWNDLTQQHHDPAPLQALGQRVQILAGEQDAHIPADETRRLAQLLPEAQLEIVPDATHALPLRQPQLIADRITAAARR
ncbi:alpha/beta hydrolase [Streptomyces sp. A3M-1-3]|uniref:alpha/beta fold hydrolase n=1 Tax=Streptomyces sp. A3M-1-3 TaxID=2962044 RepID=UPI0020B8C077|nr:alpha/beta hydrolase [Streptomyces sp. A3M-1-3]MCP3821382.1 alpha/beta hydrolase [Streptomyces sp. A3M-1-3]